MNIKKLIYISSILLSVVAACKPNDPNKMFTEIAKNINNTAPFMADEFTRFDSAKYNQEKFYYYYTLPAFVKEETDITAFNKQQKPNLQSYVDNNEGMKLFRKHKITIIYTYFDKNKKLISSIEINPLK